MALQVRSKVFEPGDAPYPMLLADLLSVDGVRAEVLNASRVLGMAEDGVQLWQRAVYANWPDLVVVHYGIEETYPGFFPKWVHHKAWSFTRTDGAIDRTISDAIRRRWKTVLRASNRLDRPWMPGQMSVRRFRHQFRRIVNQSLDLTAAKVIVVGPNPPNFQVMKLSGAYPEKRATLEVIMQDTVSGRPRGGYIDMQRVIDEIDPDDFAAALPDGLHLAAKGHRVLARMIADEYWQIERNLAAETSSS